MTEKNTDDYVHLDKKRKTNSSSEPSKWEHINENPSAVRESDIQKIYPDRHTKTGEFLPSKQEDFKSLIKKHKKSLELLAK